VDINNLIRETLPLDVRSSTHTEAGCGQRRILIMERLFDSGFRLLLKVIMSKPESWPDSVVFVVDDDSLVARRFNVDSQDQ
jgi:hypothetical protein